MSLAESSHFIPHDDGDIATISKEQQARLDALSGADRARLESFSNEELERLEDFHNQLVWDSLYRHLDRRHKLGAFDDINPARGEALLQERATQLVADVESGAIEETLEGVPHDPQTTGRAVLYLVT